MCGICIESCPSVRHDPVGLYCIKTAQLIVDIFNHLNFSKTNYEIPTGSLITGALNTGGTEILLAVNSNQQCSTPSDL